MDSSDRAPLLQPTVGEAPPAYTAHAQAAGVGAAAPARVMNNKPGSAPESYYPGSYQSGAPPGSVYAPPGYQPVQGQPQPTYLQGATVVVQAQPSVVIVGGCPACRVGVLEDDFTCLGVCCAILFFPIGILCCLAMRQRRCPNCGAIFG